jgi:transposase
MNISDFSAILNLSSQLVWRWYREHLSGFRQSQSNGEHNRHDLQLSDGQTVRVPIHEPANFGKDMAIDEKQIGESMHTIVSNRDTGKIALMVDSMRYTHLEKILDADSDQCRGIEVLTRDLSPLYASVGENLFPNSASVADKFHIIRSVIEACQDVRVRLRQDNLREKRLKHQEYKKQEKQRKQECLAVGKKYIFRKFKYQEQELSNGESVLESLARSRYLLFKYPDQWTNTQRKRSGALFEKFPEIKKVYDRCCEFRNWMKKENVGLCMVKLKEQLQNWILKVEQDDVDEMLNFKSLVERHELPILNYLRYGVTNAMAENINSQIQRFIMINQGTRDREFFYFRMRKYFT